jgi:hypothetical protein
MFDIPPDSLIDSTTNPNVKNNARIRSLGTFPSSQHFRGKGVCKSFGMGMKTNDKRVNYSHGLAQSKQ